EWSDVRSFQRWQCALAGYRASSIVCVSDHDTERALSESRANQNWIAVALLWALSRARRIAGNESAILDRLPKHRTIRVRRIIGFKRHDIGRPTCRNRNPFGLGQEERRGKKATADDEITTVVRIGTAIFCYSPPHFDERHRSVCVLKCFPSE